ncbi:MAG: NAD-dependent epimerase/dehydratase family protein [Crocinitomicaceae bacterium]|nr:NAD-dependent epimerase/dehydratase family protein [Crocinitomicaceae bacterium]
MIFVTGGTGLLGTHLLVQLSTHKIPIRALYRSESKKNKVLGIFQHYLSENAQQAYDKIEWVKGDILDLPSLKEHMQGARKVYHCAAMVSFHKSDFNNLLKINREGTENVVNIALTLNRCKLCYVSSTAAIGGLDGEMTTEDSKWKNEPTTSGYSISKYSAEKEVWRAIEEGLDAVMVNPCVILGAGNWNESSLTIFRTLKKGVSFYPPGANAVVDARDVAEIMIKLTDSNITAQRYLCIGSNQSFQVLMAEIANQLNVKMPKKPVKRWMVEVARILIGGLALFTSKKPSITKETVESLFGNKSYDASKIRKELDFTFRTLPEMVENGIKGRQL